ncbi:gamma-glutamylcyclotransferase family protein [Roseibium litorale]|uniref:Gamma-glutamylcyclotransferase n=1 Tax=Roseibium litorale TaxID=2803841 RepID=A0ABR9CPQ5_9HYPH|nr:gamma-glutamylcyclotransferase family protein [Roseibium litorale]MBD8892816.1 gamma-glutamylcyclotransferase [Roseibium litorale]
MSITYFGYGSLVNTRTLGEGASVRAGRLEGWIREWRVVGLTDSGRGICALSVAPKPGVTIRGVLVREPEDRLPALEAREKRYDKVPAIGGQFRCEQEEQPGPEDMFLFQSKPGNRDWGSGSNPILQSYIDCVLLGFYDFWGEEGIRHFIETTRGWHAPVLADRAAPIYPRAVQAAPEVIELVDQYLAPLNIRTIPV